MRLFKCDIAREDQDEAKGKYTLTGDELVEYLNNENFTVHKAEKITVDKQEIEKIMEAKLQEAYREILSHHCLNTGDITPLQHNDLESNEEQVVKTAQKWIESRLN